MMGNRICFRIWLPNLETVLRPPLGFPTPSGSLTEVFDTSVLLVAVEWRAIGPMETRGL